MNNNNGISIRKIPKITTKFLKKPSLSHTNILVNSNSSINTINQNNNEEQQDKSYISIDNSHNNNTYSNLRPEKKRKSISNGKNLLSLAVITKLLNIAEKGEEEEDDQRNNIFDGKYNENINKEEIKELEDVLNQSDRTEKIEAFKNKDNEIICNIDKTDKLDRIENIEEDIENNMRYKTKSNLLSSPFNSSTHKSFFKETSIMSRQSNLINNQIIAPFKHFQEKIKIDLQNKSKLRRYKRILKPRNYWMVFKIVFKTCKFFDEVLENVKIYGTSREIAIFCKHHENIEELFEIQERLVKMNMDRPQSQNSSLEDDFIIEFNRIEINKTRDLLSELVGLKDNKMKLSKFILYNNTLCLQVIYLIFELIILILIPIQFGYLLNYHTILNTYLIVDFIMIVDIILELFTFQKYNLNLSSRKGDGENNDNQVLDKEKPDDNPYTEEFFGFKSNLKRYILSIYFIIDLILAIPIYLMVDYIYNLNSFFLILFYILRIGKLIKYQNKIKTISSDIQEFFHFKRKIILIIEFLFSTFIYVHLFCCIWIFIGYYQNNINYYNPEDGWMYRYSMENSSIFEIYLFSFYYSITVLSTLGFGDISPKSNFEIMIVIIWMFICGVIYSNSVSKITSYVSNMHSDNRKINQQLELSHEFCKEFKFNISLKSKIINCIKTRNKNSISSLYSKKELLNELPLSLKIQITNDISKNILEKIPFFVNKTAVFNATILPMLTPIHLNKNEIIYRIYDFPHGIYFITNGMVNFLTKHNLSYKVFKTGYYFGDIELVLKIPRICTTVAVLNCSFLILEKEIYNSTLINEFSDEQKELQDDVILKYNKDIEVIKSREMTYKKNHLLKIDRNSIDNSVNNSKNPNEKMNNSRLIIKSNQKVKNSYTHNLKRKINPKKNILSLENDSDLELSSDGTSKVLISLNKRLINSNSTKNLGGSFVLNTPSPKHKIQNFGVKSEVLNKKYTMRDSIRSNNQSEIHRICMSYNKNLNKNEIIEGSIYNTSSKVLNKIENQASKDLVLQKKKEEELFTKRRLDKMRRISKVTEYVNSNIFSKNNSNINKTSSSINKSMTINNYKTEFSINLNDKSTNRIMTKILINECLNSCKIENFSFSIVSEEYLLYKNFNSFSIMINNLYDELYLKLISIEERIINSKNNAHISNYNDKLILKNIEDSYNLSEDSNNSNNSSVYPNNNPNNSIV